MNFYQFITLNFITKNFFSKMLSKIKLFFLSNYKSISQQIKTSKYYNFKMKYQVLIILIVVLICINGSKAENNQKAEQNLMEVIMNIFRTSPKELAVIKLKPSLYHACIWKICSRPLNLRRHKDFNKIEELHKQQEATEHLKNVKFSPITDAQQLKISLAMNLQRYLRSNN